MANLEEIVASLTDRLRSLELKPSPSTRNSPRSIREPKPHSPTSSTATRRHFRGFINQLELVFQLQDKRLYPGTIRTSSSQSGTHTIYLHGRLQSKDESNLLARSTRSKRLKPRSGHSDKFYSGLSSEIKDHLVHCESPVSLAAAMDQAIRIDNRIFERRTRTTVQSSFIPTQPTSKYSCFSHSPSAVPAAIHE
ncbi:hypothetical protein BASA83_006320 [Batrachochytrium salamandrivorans]|nr:hypothetical protein BASA83_006320 [Batrachochytrium salamandrivorans]